MAGGGIGTPATTTPAAPIPSGSPLDGSPKFEAITPKDVNATEAAATTAAPNLGTAFAGLPSWLSTWTGAGYGSGGATTPANGGFKVPYTPFVPGTGLSGYGGARAPTIYRPPSKPVQQEAPKFALFDAPMFDNNTGMYLMPDGTYKLEGNMSAAEMAATKNYSDWMERQRRTTRGYMGGTPADGGNGAGGNGSGGLY